MEVFTKDLKLVKPVRLGGQCFVADSEIITIISAAQQMSPSFLWLHVLENNYSYLVVDTKSKLAVVVVPADPLVVEVGMKK